MKTKMVCIMCPLGCEMEVEQTNSEILVSGNNCIRGKNYAVSELTEPQRVLTSVIITKSGVVSVKTDKPIPKKFMAEAVKLIENVKADNLVQGQLVIENILNTGSNVVVTREAVVEFKE